MQFLQIESAHHGLVITYKTESEFRVDWRFGVFFFFLEKKYYHVTSKYWGLVFERQEAWLAPATSEI